jgi:hypothetical protein
MRSAIMPHRHGLNYVRGDGILIYKGDSRSSLRQIYLVDRSLFICKSKGLTFNLNPKSNSLFDLTIHSPQLNIG